MSTSRVSRAIAVLALIGCQSVPGLRAQALPNFSGTWTRIPGAGTEWVRQVGSSKPLIIEHTDTTFTVGSGATKKSFRIGAETKREETIAGVVRTITAKVAWVGSKLILTEEWSLTKREDAYSLDDQGRLILTGSTTLLFTRGGVLTVDTIGPITSVYKKVEGDHPGLTTRPRFLALFDRRQPAR